MAKNILTVKFSEDTKTDCKKKCLMQKSLCMCFGCSQCASDKYLCINRTFLHCILCNKYVCDKCLSENLQCMYCQYFI